MNLRTAAVLQGTIFGWTLIAFQLTAVEVRSEPPGDKQAKSVSEPDTSTLPKKAGKNKTILISVRGQAIDGQGEPISRAEIYLASVMADWKRLAETKTDAKGHFEFKLVALPTELADESPEQCFGAFEVFGQAEGFGFAWRPKTRVMAALDADDPREEFDLDLAFPPPARLFGQVMDELDQPLPEARVDIRYCEPLTARRFGSGSEFDSLNQTDSAPPGMKIRITDKDGRFEFTGLPPDCRFRIDVRPKGHPSRWVWGATTHLPQPDYFDSKILTGEMKLSFVSPLEIPIRVVTGDGGQPAAKVSVSLYNPAASKADESDADGRVSLKVPPGEYKIALLPARGTPYLHTTEKFDVGKTPPTEPVVVKLRRAAVVDVIVVEEGTEEGIEGFDLWQEVRPDAPGKNRPFRDQYYSRSWEKPTAHVDRPKTDKAGNLRAFMEPGLHRIGVGLHSKPDGFHIVDSQGLEIDCKAGKTVTVMFHVRKL